MFPTGRRGNAGNSLIRASKHFGKAALPATPSWLWKHQPQGEKKTPRILTLPFFFFNPHRAARCQQLSFHPVFFIIIFKQPLKEQSPPLGDEWGFPALRPPWKKRC